MAVPHLPLPRPATHVPPAPAAARTASAPPAPTTGPSANVVPIRPKPPAFPAPSAVTGPVIIEADVVEYLTKASLEQRWRILSRVAAATRDELPLPRASSAPPPPPERASDAPPPSERRSIEPPRAGAAPSVDHAEQLFQAMRDLPGLPNAPAAARFCLEAALRAVPCLAGLVHLRDRATGDLVVAHAQGPRAEALLHARTPREDALVARAAAAGKPTVVAYGAEPGAETQACARHAFFDAWSVAVVPVLHGGQVLALLELVDPIDGRPFDEHAQGALAYVAARLAKFLADHVA